MGRNSNFRLLTGCTTPSTKASSGGPRAFQCEYALLLQVVPPAEVIQSPGRTALEIISTLSAMFHLAVLTVLSYQKNTGTEAVKATQLDIADDVLITCQAIRSVDGRSSTWLHNSKQEGFLLWSHMAMWDAWSHGNFELAGWPR